MKKNKTSQPVVVDDGKAIHSNTGSPRIPRDDEAFASLREQVALLDDKFKRAIADYQNQEKRHEVQRSLLVKFANESLLAKILPVLDDLERAQNHLQDAGLGHVLKTFHQALAAEGVSIISTDNADFDPSTMDCTEVVAGPKDKVVKTVSKGYFLFDKVLRPAKVEVGNGVNHEDTALRG